MKKRMLSAAVFVFFIFQSIFVYARVSIESEGKFFTIYGTDLSSDRPFAVTVTEKGAVLPTIGDGWTDITENYIYIGQKSSSDNSSFTVDMSGYPAGSQYTVTAYDGELNISDIVVSDQLTEDDIRAGEYGFTVNNKLTYAKVLRINGNSVTINFGETINKKTVTAGGVTFEEVKPGSAETIRKIYGTEVANVTSNSVELTFPVFLRPTAVYRVTLKNIFTQEGKEYENIIFYMISDALINYDFSDYQGETTGNSGLVVSAVGSDEYQMTENETKLILSRVASNGNRCMEVKNNGGGVLTNNYTIFNDIGSGTIDWVFKIKPKSLSDGGIKLRLSNRDLQYADLGKLKIDGDKTVVYKSNSGNDENLAEFSKDDWLNFRFTFNQTEKTYSLKINDTLYIDNENMRYTGYKVHSYNMSDSKTYEGEEPYNFEKAKFDIVLPSSNTTDYYLIDDYKIFYKENGKAVADTGKETAVEFYDCFGNRLKSYDSGIYCIKVLFENDTAMNEALLTVDNFGNGVLFDKITDGDKRVITLTPNEHIAGDYVLNCNGNSYPFTLKEISGDALTASVTSEKDGYVTVSCGNGSYTDTDMMFIAASYNDDILSDAKITKFTVPRNTSIKKYTFSTLLNAQGDTYKYYILTSDLTPSGLFEKGDFAVAYLGDTPILNNMTAEQKSSASPISTVKYGRGGYVLIPGNFDEEQLKADGDYNSLLINIGDGIINEGENALLEIDYFDEGNGSFAVFYDGMTDSLTETDYVVLTDTGRWKTARFILQDGCFKNGTDGADIKISLYSDTMNYSTDGVCIGRVKLKPLKTKSSVNIKTESSRAGNIFNSSETPNFVVTFNCSETEKLNVTYRLFDENGVAVWNEEKIIDLKTTDTLSFIPEKYGIYTLVISAENTEKGIQSVHKEKLSYSADATNFKNDRLGVCDMFSAELGAAAGFGWADGGNSSVRIKYVKDGTSFNIPSQYTDDISEFEKYGINLMTEIGSGDSDFYFAEGERSPRSPEGLDVYGDYCEYVSDGIKGGLYTGKTFETWNEFDGAANHDNRPYDEYANFIKIAGERIRKNNPDAKIVGPSSAGNGEKILYALGEADALGYLDVCSIHPYNLETDPKSGKIVESIKKIREILDKYGETDLPIWISEVGWADECYGISGTKQGSYIVQLYVMLAENNLADKMFIYRFRDRADLKNDAESSFGIINHSGTAKPAYLMISAMNCFLSGAEFTGKNEENGISSYSFKDRNDEKITVVWTNTDEKELNTAGISYDAYGNVISTGGMIKVGYSPVYIKGDILNI